MKRSTALIEQNNVNGPTTEIRNLSTLGEDITGVKRSSYKHLNFGSANAGSARNLAIQTTTTTTTGGDLKKSGYLSQYHQDSSTTPITTNVKSSLIHTGKTSGVYTTVDMAPRLVDVKTTQGEEKVTTIRGEPIQVGERIGEPVLVSTIEKGSKVISRNYTGK
jgi:hypothetical protein